MGSRTCGQCAHCEDDVPGTDPYTQYGNMCPSCLVIFTQYPVLAQWFLKLLDVKLEEVRSELSRVARNIRDDYDD